MSTTKVDWGKLLDMSLAREQRSEVLLKELLPELPEYEKMLVDLDNAQSTTRRIRVQMVERKL